MLRIGIAVLVTFFSIAIQAEDVFRPYVLALESTNSVENLKNDLNQRLQKNNFTVVGQYQPANDANRWVMIINHKELTNAVTKVGGLSAFASTLRVAITNEGSKTLVTYTTPEYWARAYFTESFTKVESSIQSVSKALNSVFINMPGYINTPFGSKKGLDADDLEDYNYMLGMPKFDDTEMLAEFDSYEDATAKIDENLKNGVLNVKLIYKYKIPGKDLTVYGLGLSGENGESKFLPIIDVSSPKHTAFLPYEVLVMENEVHMLHGRYRIALSFPDLTMGTFTKIMSTPGAIEEMLEGLVN